MAYPELVSTISSAITSYALNSMAILASKSESVLARKPKTMVDPQSNTAIKLRPHVGKKELTRASGMKALALSFEPPLTLLGLIPSSVRRGTLRLLSGHHRLEAGHLGHQQIDMRLILHPLFKSCSWAELTTPIALARP